MTINFLKRSSLDFQNRPKYVFIKRSEECVPENGGMSLRFFNFEQASIKQ